MRHPLRLTMIGDLRVWMCRSRCCGTNVDPDEPRQPSLFDTEPER